MKNLKLKRVNFLQPVMVNTRGTSRLEKVITRDQVDELEFISSTWLKIVLRGQTILVSVYNVMSLEPIDDAGE